MVDIFIASQEADGLFRRALASNKGFAAINVYLALVQYCCDNSDAALQLLAGYLQNNPLSLSAHNLKAAIICKLHGPQAAEQALRVGGTRRWLLVSVMVHAHNTVHVNPLGGGGWVS